MSLDNQAQDAAVMKRAHPFRTAEFSVELADGLKQHVGAKEWQRFCDLLRDETIAAVNLPLAIAESRLDGLTQVLQMSIAGESSTDVGAVIPLLVMMRHLERPYPIFRIEDALADILTRTDISDDLTVSMLPLPFPRLYLELGQSRNLGLTVSNIASGKHVFEGAYIEEALHPHAGKGYHVVLTGSPLGKRNLMDDATHSLFIPTGSENARLQDVLSASVKAGNQHAREHGLRETPAERVDEAYECVLMLIKALLYISLPDARREAHPERTEALRQLQQVKSGGKRAKAERRLGRLADYIVIKAAPEHEKTFAQTTREGGVKPHWRRAHYRMQAYGPGMTLRKLVFITEVLVAAGGSGVEAIPSSYTVR